MTEEIQFLLIQVRRSEREVVEGEKKKKLGYRIVLMDQMEVEKKGWSQAEMMKVLILVS